jgi:hypothetical protein
MKKRHTADGNKEKQKREYDDPANQAFEKHRAP